MEQHSARQEHLDQLTVTRAEQIEGDESSRLTRRRIIETGDLHTRRLEATVSWMQQVSSVAANLELNRAGRDIPHDREDGDAGRPPGRARARSA
jgi:hypothetical protein